MYHRLELRRLFGHDPRIIGKESDTDVYMLADLDTQSLFYHNDL